MNPARTSDSILHRFRADTVPGNAILNRYLLNPFEVLLFFSKILSLKQSTVASLKS
jgi:hypothetical protein